MKTPGKLGVFCILKSSVVHFWCISRGIGAATGCQCTRMRCGDCTGGGAKILHLRDGSSIRASLVTASGVTRPRSLSKATLNCAARILRRTCRASSLRDAGSVRSFPSGVLKVSNGDGNRGGASCARRTTASGVCRPWTSSKVIRSWAARIPLRIRRMVSSLDARASSSAADIGSLLSVRCVHDPRVTNNRQGTKVQQCGRPAQPISTLAVARPGR